MHTQIPTGSTSKWPSAMMFAGLVDDGKIESLDDPLGKYLSWWTKNESDPRSTVTTRMLLSFTSGFGGGHPGEEMNTRQARRWRNDNDIFLENFMASADACNATTGDVVECAKGIYTNVKLIGTPGKVYSYVCVLLLPVQTHTQHTHTISLSLSLSLSLKYTHHTHTHTTGTTQTIFKLLQHLL